VFCIRVVQGPLDTHGEQVVQVCDDICHYIRPLMIIMQSFLCFICSKLRHRSKLLYEDSTKPGTLWRRSLVKQKLCQGSHASLNVLLFFSKLSRTWKVMENDFYPGKYCQLLKVMESPGIYL